MNLIDKFFQKWGALTRTEYRHYNILKWFGREKVIGVNWPIITFGLAVMACMVIFLPGGLITWALS